MNIGYACLNNSIPMKMKTFRLKTYTDNIVREAIATNIRYAKEALLFNVQHEIQFFRFSSDIVPFASHAVNAIDWKKEFANQFKELGDIVKKHAFRTSFHPDQFVVLNSKSETVIQNGINELEYHVSMFKLMELDTTHKLQIHVGGVFGDKLQSSNRFIETYKNLSQDLRDRLVIENDDRSYSLKDCLYVHEKTGIPILFDIFHHQCLNNGESAEEAFARAAATWSKKDGTPMMDYSSQHVGKRVGAHIESIDLEDFKKYVPIMTKYKFNVMLEIKDKEASALKAVSVL